MNTEILQCLYIDPQSLIELAYDDAKCLCEINKTLTKQEISDRIKTLVYRLDLHFDTHKYVSLFIDAYSPIMEV